MLSHGGRALTISMLQSAAQYMSWYLKVRPAGGSSHSTTNENRLSSSCFCKSEKWVGAKEGGEKKEEEQKCSAFEGGACW